MKTISLLTLLASLLVFSICWGQELSDAPTPKPNVEKTSFRSTITPVIKHRDNQVKFFTTSKTAGLILLAGLDAADGFTTASLDAKHFRENNPIARPFVNTPASTAFYFAGSYLVTIGEMKLAQHFERTHPNHAKLWRAVQHTILWGSVGDELYCVQHNTRELVNYNPLRAPIPPPPPLNCGPSACIVKH